MNEFSILYIYIYIYMCCRVKIWSKIWGFIESKFGPRFGFLSQNLVRLRLHQNLVQDFYWLVFPQFYNVVWVSYKTQIVCRGEKIFLGSSSRCQTKGFRKNVRFLFLSFLCWRKRKYEKNATKRKFQKKKKTDKLCFGGGCEQKDVFCRNGIFQK